MRALALLCALFLASCGGRVANPVALERSFDDALTCTHLAGEHENNFKRLSELTGESKDKVRDNFGLLISSPLFLDFSNTQKEEVAAILARNERLSELMKVKGCRLPDIELEVDDAP